MFTVKHNINPTLKIIMTAGIAESLRPRRTIAPGSCISENITFTIVMTVALKFRSIANTQMNAADIVKANVIAKEVLKSIYCSQNINGIPKIKRSQVIENVDNVMLRMLYLRDSSIIPDYFRNRRKFFECS